jgi:hypothetical protein
MRTKPKNVKAPFGEKNNRIETALWYYGNFADTGTHHTQALPVLGCDGTDG